MEKEKAKATPKKAATKKPAAKNKVSAKELISKRDELQAKAQKLSTDLDKKLIPAGEIDKANKNLNKMVNDIVALNEKIG